MKLAFSKPTANDHERNLLFENYKKIGYEGLQLKAGQYSSYLDNPEDFLKEWSDYEGISSAVIMGGGLDESAKENIVKLAEFSKKIGAERLIYCMMINREGLTGEDIRSCGKVFNEMGKEVSDMGLKLTLHNHYNSPVMYREDIHWFFDHKGKTEVGLTVDTAHFVKSGVHNIAEIINDFSPIIDNYHIKDIKHGEFVVLGRGTIDFEPVFDAIKATKYTGWVSTDEESDCALIESMEQCYTYLSGGLFLHH